MVRIGDADDPGAEGDLVALQAVGISAAVEAFVVMQHDGDRLAQVRGGLEDDLPDARMLADRLPLVVGEGGRLVQDLLGDRDLSEVVQERSDSDALDLLVRQTHLQTDPGRERRDHV